MDHLPLIDLRAPPEQVASPDGDEQCAAVTLEIGIDEGGPAAIAFVDQDAAQAWRGGERGEELAL